MCTAITYQTRDFYFGRNLDLHISYGEKVTITPRNYPFLFRCGKKLQHHYAIIGMAAIADGYPLYFDATNEQGLSLAGLNFPDNAVYYPKAKDLDNITPFELIPWILGQCKTVDDALTKLEILNLWDEPFSKLFPQSPLHWLLSDKNQTVVLEPLSSGLQVIDNPLGILTNNPPFDYHMYNLANYMNLTTQVPQNRFSQKIDVKPYSLGMGGFGLPGDLSSGSRFIKASFTKLNSVCGASETESITQFFHILGSVAQQRGLTAVGNTEYEFTLYSSCCNTDRGIYYYTTYENRQINAVSMCQENLDGNQLITYPLLQTQQINVQN